MPPTSTLRRVSLLLLVPLAGCGGGHTGPEPDGPPDFSGIMSPAELAALDGERGVVKHTDAASPGYTLVAPLNSTRIHLVDLDGEVRHTWETGESPGMQYLLEDGTLLRTARDDADPKFHGGGIAGWLRRLAPDGEVLWSHHMGDEHHWQHHDLEPLPNGNLLVIAWERLSKEEAIARGRHPRAVGDEGLWTDMVLELRPTSPEGAEVVWEWHAKDHLIQHADAALRDHGDPADHPGRIDINYDVSAEELMTPEERREQEELESQMAALGYGGEASVTDDDPPAAGTPPPDDKPYEPDPDWTHTNAVDYQPELDLIVLSSPEMCEIFVIDHSTTTEEARGTSGGRYGHGGELLWRWGNPVNYGHGTKEDKHLYYQHDPTWQGTSDAPHLLVFNNGGRRPDGNRSTVEELVLPFERGRGFTRADGQPFGPAEPVWKYEDAATFFSAFISGAQRQPNGNTLICAGAPGHVFEVTPAGELVWDWFNPLGGDVDPPDHAGKAPPLALFRAHRYPPDHPGVKAVLAGR